MAHKMAAPCKHIQAKKLHSKLIELEELAKGKNQENMGNIISEMEKEIAQTNSYIRNYLENRE